MTESPARPRPRASLVAIGVLVGLWIVVVGWLAVLPKETAASANRLVWSLPFARDLLPPHITDLSQVHIDLVLHFVFYLPFGLLAAAAGVAARRRDDEVLNPRVALFIAGGACAWAGIDELRQLAIVDRSSTWLDFLGGAAGVCFGLAVAWILAAGLHKARRWIGALLRARRARRGLSPCPSPPPT